MERSCINATEGVEDVFDALGLPVDEEMLDGIDSFGGFILTHLGREPSEATRWNGRATASASKRPIASGSRACGRYRLRRSRRLPRGPGRRRRG